MNITVYLNASEGNDPSLREAVQKLGTWDRSKWEFSGLRRIKDWIDGCACGYFGTNQADFDKL